MRLQERQNTIIELTDHMQIEFSEVLRPIDLKLTSRELAVAQVTGVDPNVRGVLVAALQEIEEVA
jgi:spore coat protein CotF